MSDCSKRRRKLGAGLKPRALVCYRLIDRRRRMAPHRCLPAVMFRRRSDETIFQSLRNRPEMITS